MGKFGKFGSDLLDGPYYPKSGVGKWTGTPVSKLPKLGTIGAAYTAADIGYKIGSHLDNHYKWSDRASDWAADHTPSSAKWWIHKNL